MFEKLMDMRVIYCEGSKLYLFTYAEFDYI